MKQKYIFPLSLLILYNHVCANVQPVIPGEPLYGVVSRIGTGVDEANSGISSIETQLQSISFSNIDVLTSLVENLTQSISASSIDTLTSTVETLGSSVDLLVNNTSAISAQDALIYNTVTGIDTKVDTLLLNNYLITSIYDTVTEIDTKVDTISSQNVILYNLESVIDSKVDEIRSYPDFVQTPTAFQSQGINAQTSRYFFTKRSVGGGATEQQVFSLRNNSANTVVRISAVGCGLDSGVGAGSGSAVSVWVPLYKNATLSGASFSPFDPSSALSINTAGTFTGGTQVYELQAGITASGVPRAFEYIPKELYSVIIAPGETLTVAAGIGAGSNDATTVIIMWEEIISY